MFSGVSYLRRLKTRFRRITMTNLIVIVLTLTLVLFITSMFSHNNYENDRASLEFPKSSPIVSLPRLQIVKEFLTTNETIKNSVVNDGNQIDKPEQAKTVPSAIYKDGVLGNYELVYESSLKRPGDNGTKFLVSKEAGVDQTKIDEIFKEYGVNMMASDRIPMDRVVPDIRHPECKYWHYPDKLPTTSVVIVFHNEGLTTLVRTAHSVLIRSPRKLVREVILLDDASEKENLKVELEDYIKEHFGEFKDGELPTYSAEMGNTGESLNEKSGKVRLVRNHKRQGLIRSRSRGAQAATGDVIVFLDAHCEVNHDWLPPLLAPIAANRKTLTVPIIDGIDSNSFEYRPVYSRNDEHFRGIWEWGMLYKEISLDMKEHLKSHRISEPYDSPTHAGGLFAIDRLFFAELGYYDPGLLIWGGENFELSFKIWQCGGRLQWVPCSRVGHIYRPFMPYSFGSMANQRKGPLVLTNYKRVVEVWFDDAYKEYFYTREPLARFYDHGDITKQLELKKSLGCKPFDWFMKNIASDVFRDFPRLPANVEWGEIRLKGTDKCLDTKSTQPPQTITVSQCHGLGGNQLFRLNSAGLLSVGERCIDANKSKMTLNYCVLGTVNGPWKLQGDFMIHKNKNWCLTYDNNVHLGKCDYDGSESLQQHWEWRKIRPNVYDD